jgi:hypothetical protein
LVTTDDGGRGWERVNERGRKRWPPLVNRKALSACVTCFCRPTDALFSSVLAGVTRPAAAPEKQPLHSGRNFYWKRTVSRCTSGRRTATRLDYSMQREWRVCLKWKGLPRSGTGARLVVNNCFPGNQRPLVVVAASTHGLRVTLGSWWATEEVDERRALPPSPRCRLLITEERSYSAAVILPPPPAGWTQRKRNKIR